MPSKCTIRFEFHFSQLFHFQHLTLLPDVHFVLTPIQDKNGHSSLQRTWQLRTAGTLHNIGIALNKNHLPDTTDSIALILLNTDDAIIQTILPDSTDTTNRLCYTISRPAARTLFSFHTTKNGSHRHSPIGESTSRDNKNNKDYADNGTYTIRLSPNPTAGEYILDISLPQTEDLVLTIQDPVGKTIVRHTLTGAADYRHCGVLPATGMYIFSVYTQGGELLGTRELLVY